MTLSKEVKVGLLALISGIVLYFGFNFLKGSELFSSSKKYFVVYNNIDGLTPSNPVLLNGLQVGKVSDIQILSRQNNPLLVRFEVSSDITLTDSAQAILADNGLLGGKVIELSVGRGSRILDGDDTLQSVVEGGVSALLQQRALPVLNHLETLTASLNKTVSQFDSTGYLLNQTLRNFRQTSVVLNGLLKDNRGNLGGTMTNFRKLSSSLVETEKELKPLLAKMNNVADTLSQLRLNQAVQNANRSIASLNAILSDINAGKGTLGKVAKNDSLYTNINKATTDLDRLFVDLRRNPKRYVHFSIFGPKDKALKDSTRVKKRK